MRHWLAALGWVFMAGVILFLIYAETTSDPAGEYLEHETDTTP